MRQSRSEQGLHQLLRRARLALVLRNAAIDHGLLEEKMDAADSPAQQEYPYRQGPVQQEEESRQGVKEAKHIIPWLASQAACVQPGKPM
jgi:hypothetical protein